MQKCAECGADISSTAKSCPQCGKELKKKRGCGKVVLIGVGILVLIGVIGSITNSGSSSRSTTSSSSSSSSSSRDEVTYSEYQRIADGMSYNEAVGIIGFEGEEMSRSNVAGYSTVMYMWSNRNGSNMNATFQNDEMVLKAQFGLD